LPERQSRTDLDLRCKELELEGAGAGGRAGAEGVGSQLVVMGVQDETVCCVVIIGCSPHQVGST
jgi:hypothetical protein